MKKTRSSSEVKNQVPADEVSPEHDFRQSTRNPYASRCAAGNSVAVLESDVAAAFPTAAEANQAETSGCPNFSPILNREPWNRRVRPGG